jgi:hypothetical protein
VQVERRNQGECGWTREVPAETAATRLLDELGFPADHMSRRGPLFWLRGLAVSCALGRTDHLDRPFDRVGYDHAIDFVNVGVERKLEGRRH